MTVDSSVEVGLLPDLSGLCLTSAVAVPDRAGQK